MDNREFVQMLFDGARERNRRIGRWNLMRLLAKLNILGKMQKGD